MYSKLSCSVLFVFYFVSLLSTVIGGNSRLEEYFKWNQITFAANLNTPDGIFFPDVSTMPDLRGYEIQGNYIPYNNVPMGVTHHKGRLFVTVPRRRPGVPATLNYVLTKSTKGSSPSFRAFPNFLVNELHPHLEPDAQRIISVYRTRVDECNRLWFIDTGLLEYPNNATQVQRPSIWVYNLENDELIRRFEIPESIVQRGNGLASITVDVEPNNCNDAYGYIPDLANYRLYVYSFRQNHIWSISHNFFNFDPLHGDFNVAGLRYQWNDGIFSITLGRKNPDGYKTAYFHAMASTSEFTVSTRILRSEELSTRSNHGDDFKYLGDRGTNSQSAMHDYDELSGVMFYSQVAINGIACWNTATPFTSNNHAIIARDDTEMIYPSDLNVDSDGVLWVMTNSMPRFIYDRLNPREFNFRIWRQSAEEAIRGTACATNRNYNHNGY